MINEGFVQNPPHPEKDWSACTVPVPGAAILKLVFDYPVRDTSICAGADGWYYLTGTTGYPDWDRSNDGIMLWKSCDLVNWISVGLVWSIEQDGTWQKEYRAVKDGNEKVRAVWSPEIHYFRNTFWLTYAMNWGAAGLLKSSSGKAEGPYEDMGIITYDGTDASIFEDDDGKVYWVYQNGKIARMKDDLTGLAEVPHEIRVRIITGPRQETQGCIGTHGAFLKKINGLYFLFCGQKFKRMYDNDNEDTFAAVSKNIYGPYSRRYLAVPHGGQVTVFCDKSGSLLAGFSGHGQYSAVKDRPAIVPLELAEPDFIRPSGGILLENSSVAGLKPVKDFPIRDTQVCTGHDGKYYMTGTSNRPDDSFWDPNDGIHLLQSCDMAEWEHVGLVWDMRKEGTWQNTVKARPMLWAPELHYIKNTYWLTYSLAGGSTGLLKSKSGMAAGPYVDMGRVTNTNIDSSLFADEDGAIYYVWQNGKIALMKKDMSGFAEEPRQLLTVDGETVGYEGAFIVRYRGKYILGAAEWNGDRRTDGTYDLMYATANNIYGPYSSRKLAVPHGGHGTMFIDREGNLMCTLFGNDRTAPFRTSPGIIKLSVKEGNSDIEIVTKGEY